MKLASIESVSISPHPNADKLELARVLGWQCVVRKGEFKTGDLAVFVAPDTILPKAPWSEFLSDGKDAPIRLRPAKLRGEFSQGLLLPLGVLPEPSRYWHVGADVGAELGVRKYEKEMPAQLSGEAAGPFPSWIACRTDEDNYQAVPEQLAAVLVRQPLYISTKLDGSSMTVVVEHGKVTHVCSRNIDLKPSDTNAFWIAARPVVEKANPDDHFVIQGELMGPGIQGNQLGLLSPTLYVFQIRDLDSGGYMCAWDTAWCINRLGLLHVPVIRGGFEADDAVFTAESLQELADNAKLDNGAPAEGIVVRPRDVETMGNGRPLSVKVINRSYKD